MLLGKKVLPSVGAPTDGLLSAEMTVWTWQKAERSLLQVLPSSFGIDSSRMVATSHPEHLLPEFFSRTFFHPQDNVRLRYCRSLSFQNVPRPGIEPGTFKSSV